MVVVRGGYSLVAWTQELWPMGLVAPQHVKSSWTRDQTHVPSLDRQILNYWTMGKMFSMDIFKLNIREKGQGKVK